MRQTAAKNPLSAFYISRGGAAECRADFSITARRHITVRDGCGRCRRRIARPSGVTKIRAYILNCILIHAGI
jgi:hypothetical protein